MIVIVGHNDINPPGTHGPRPTLSRIVGDANEGFATVNGTLSRGLIDTGLQVTTIATHFYHRH